jgi:plastocyanin
VAGERFDFATRCMPGNTTRNDSITIGASTTHNTVLANGSVMLPTPSYNASSTVDVNEEQNTVDINVNFMARQGVGLQCLGEGAFLQEVNVTDGAWNIAVAVTAENETLTERLEAVQVPAETDEQGTNETATETETNTTGQNQTDTTNTAETNQSETGQTEVVLEDNAFQPESIAVEQGDTVVFVNNGDNRHNVNIPELGVDEDVESGAQVSFEITETGTFDLACSYHEPAMSGQITVT